jgi:hypothetical protein
MAISKIKTNSISDDAVTAAKIADGTIVAADLAADSVDSSELVAGSVDTAHIAADNIVASLIADNAIDSEHYTDGSIDNEHIADDAIDSEHYAAGSIDNEHIADDAIDSEHYADGSIDNAHIADDAIDSEHYADGSIDNAHIADDQIGSEHYAAGSVDTTALGADAVTAAKIADDVVNSEHYAAASIDNEHLADDAVGVAELSATGTASSSTFLRGDNAWTAISGFSASDITGGTDYGNIPPATGDSIIFHDTSASALREITIANLGNTPAFHAHASSTQSISNTTDTFITYGTEIIDTHSAYDGTNKFTVPANCGGKYLIGAILTMAITDGSRFAVHIRKGGSTGMAETIPHGSNSGSRDAGASVVAIVSLGAGEYVQIRTWQNTGGTINSAGILQNSQFWGFRLTGM